MTSIRSCPLPDGALLARYADAGAYTDCYATDIAGAITHAQFVTAFYTTALFKLERFVLKWALSRPSTDAQAAQLAAATLDDFAAWHVEQRAENQVLLCDFNGRTRSWLMVAPVASVPDAMTRLYFGSAVVPVRNARTGIPAMGIGFKALLGFHKRYSQALLSAAKARLQSKR